MSDYFIFGGIDCRTYGIRAFENETYGATPVKYNVVSVPGKNGDLLFNLGNYPNRSISYSCLIYKGDSMIDGNNQTATVENAVASYESFRAAIMAKTDYQVLRDSKYPNEYFKAYINTELLPKITVDKSMVKFVVSFMRKPQRYLDSGDTVTTLNATGTITNPTLYVSKPNLKVYGNGIIGVGPDSITIVNNADNNIDIDCEAGISHRGATNMNSSVTLSGIDFPVLKAGVNNISLGTGITKVEITPRWWTI